MNIDFEHNGIFIHLEVENDDRVSLRNCSLQSNIKSGTGCFYPLNEIQINGYNQNDHHGSKHTMTSPADLLKYERHEITENAFGRILTIVQKADPVRVLTQWQFFKSAKVIRCTVSVENTGKEDIDLQYISSFAITGIGWGKDPRRDESYRLWLPHTTWKRECQWKKYSLSELGYDPIDLFSLKRIEVSSAGTWPCSEYLPMGCFEQEDQAMLWQIEAGTDWQWEITDLDGQLCLRAGGAQWQDHQFMKTLHPGEVFTSVPCAVAFGSDFETAVQEMTAYRRLIRRKNADNDHPSVIFNDYMNCLDGDPTTEKEIPLIDAAAKAGCKYYCIDAGWYADGAWWDGVGEWMPSKQRFPNGIEEVLQYIKSKGMIPGLWLEIEVMGINCPMADKVPDDWFFCIRGKRVIDHSRYQLDFRNPAVRKYADSVIDRLVNRYGVGYIKMDYNINAGMGTDIRSDSVGEGLTEHTKAYHEWLDNVFTRYPDLVIENCSSGGMRMEYSMLQRHSIQSITDQTNYIDMAVIAANCMTACTPEQAAIWSYPMRAGNEEETIFNMVSAMLLRIHQSGHLAELSNERFDLVREGIALHKDIVEKTKNGVPFWPIGIASFDDSIVSVGIDCGSESYMAVWHRNEGMDDFVIPMRNKTKAELVYPSSHNTMDFRWKQVDGSLKGTVKGIKARLFKLV